MNDNQTFILLFRQLGLMLDAGVPLLTSIKLLADHEPKKHISQLLQTFFSDLLAGMALHVCIKNNIKNFDNMTIRLIQIGEQTGHLGQMFKLLADNKEKEFNFIKQIKQALAYPIIVTIIGLLVSVCLFFFVIPKFADLFQQKIAALPLLTRVLFAGSSFLKNNIFIFLLPLILSMGLFLPLPFCRAIKRNLSQNIRNLPGIKLILQKIEITQFARQLSILFSAGITILTALESIGESASNKQTIIIASLYQNMNDGLSLHQAMQEMSYFPALMVQMVKIGEETGKLDLMLEQVAVLYEKDVEQNLRQLTNFLEPLIMTILGVLIGGIVIGMYMPLFKLGSILA